MKSLPFSRCIWSLTAACLLWFTLDATAKPIRLRNQVLAAKAAAAATAQSAAQQGAVSGMFIIQFRQAPTAEMRAQVAASGAELLHYVPDDAYLARLTGARLEVLRALPYVEAVTQYRPEHKVHQSLQTKARSAPNEELGVAVLLAPRSRGSDIAEARRAFRAVENESTLRRGTVLRGKLRVSQIQKLSTMDSVLWVEPAHAMKMSDEVASKIVAGDGGPHMLYTQSLGYDGTGVTVAVADSGLNNGDAATMHPDLAGRTPAFFHYGQLTDAADEHSHGTHVAGIIAGNGATGEVDENGALYGLGVAPGAGIIAQRIFDGVGNYEAPPSFERLTRDAVRSGADIGSNSWGDDTQGRYDLSAMEFDELVRDADALTLGDQQYILEFSAGNAGDAPQTIGSPAVAKNVIATGASQNDRVDFIIYGDGIDAMADFSSRGPCEDGRIKPDVVAPGTWISSLQSASATAEYAWAEISDNYQYQGGTSQAGPHASGAAAVFVQYYRQSHNNQTPSPALVKAALINCAVDMDDASGTGPVPNMDEGWGRIDLTALVDPLLIVDYVNQDQPLTNGQVFERKVLVASGDEPLKVTLAYTDVPGFPGAIPALVNDLDLEVSGPDGTVYRGNQFAAGESVPNAPQADRINNVEAVHLAHPLPGQYVVRVKASNVVEDAREDTPETDQDFALVISSDLAPPGTGIVSMDRQAYRVPGTIKLQVTDADQAGRPSVTVNLSSTSEAAGETITLKARDASGVFTGAVVTATGPAVPDGRLQVAHGDQIEARYTDVPGLVTRTARAVADLLPPVLTAVSITNRFGQAYVSWDSGELTDALMIYGTNPVQSQLHSFVSESLVSSNHVLVVSGLTPGVTYYTYLVSTDLAGNTATNNNGGTLFSFQVMTTPPLLLVDQYTNNAMLFGAPPLSGYTEALDRVGIPYDIWDTTTLGEPNFGILNSYRAVIWRPADFDPPGSATERLAISNYVYSGGSLLVASMELLTRLEEVGATNFIRNVLQIDAFVTDPGDMGAEQIIGTPLEPLTTGLDIVMDYTVYENLWGGFIGPDISDTITPGRAATPMLENDFGAVVGSRWPGLGGQAPGKVVYLSFPLDAVPMGSGVNDRVNLLRNLLTFLAPGSPGLESISLNSPKYGLPSVATVEVSDSGRAGAGTVAANVRSLSQTNPFPVTLQETTRTGHFIGAFEIISATNAPWPGKLRGTNGDSVFVQYVDSTGALLASAALIDTAPPLISNVVSSPAYVTAGISWDTSEETDALVEFGKSVLLGRNVYASGFTDFHELTIPFLEPDTLYYYRVTSTDPAGNTTVDDNGGKFYTFTTLRPVMPPWSDNLDTGAPGWSTYSDSSLGLGSQSTEWTLGVPQNSLGPAHSAPNAWGCNLAGAATDSAQCFLISPALYLTNGNVATLRFWHNYEFTDLSGYDIEFGEVQVVGEDGTSAVLADYSDSSYGWEEQQLNLSAYTGKIIYIVWYYFLWGMDTGVRPGWLVDDVSISMSTVAPGTVQITNNLWQASYVLSGTASKRGKGVSAVITNAVPGEYIIEYADLPYYITPPSQTNTLTEGGTIVFQGVYTFPDVNGNGISDLWEQRFFGNVSTNRTRFTDSDGDGMTDYAEFLAGTDPNSPNPGFRLTAQRVSGTTLRLQWPSGPGQQYRVYASSNLVSWSPYTAWMEATGLTTRVESPLPTGASRSFFRVQAGATNSPAGMPQNLSVSVQRLPNGVVQLQWPSSRGRGYRVLASTNGVVWTPFSNWLLATTSKTSYTLPTPGAGSPYLFKVEVQP